MLDATQTLTTCMELVTSTLHQCSGERSGYSFDELDQLARQTLFNPSRFKIGENRKGKKKQGKVSTAQIYWLYLRAKDSERSRILFLVSKATSCPGNQLDRFI